jgi:hypothetical protein
MPRLAEEGTYQEPEIPIDENKDIVLVKVAAAARLKVRIYLSAGRTDPIVVIDGDLQDHYRGPVPAGRILELKLEPGKYRVDAAASGAMKRFEVVGLPGEVIDVEF